ncbi:hypothetical protein MHK_000213, partial [Candidatus Magnetomorum sp. HK-1]
DGQGNAVQTFTLVINNTNDTPAFTSTPVTPATEDSVYEYSITVQDVDTSDVLIIGYSSLPSWLSLTDNGNGTAMLSGTPLNANVGSNPVVLTATDSNSVTAIAQSFTITVDNTNDAPSIVSTALTAVDEDSPYTYTINVEDVDAGDSISITISTLPSWLSFSANGYTAVLQGTPENDDVGVTNTLTITATDGSGITDTQSFVITVSNTNDTPAISSIGDLTTNEDQMSSSIAFSVTDVDTDALTITITTSDGAILPADSQHCTISSTSGITYSISAGSVTTSLTMLLTPAENANGSVNV